MSKQRKLDLIREGPERGIIFDGALVPGVMSGAITVTSRAMKPQLPDCWSIPPARLVDGWFNRFGCARDDESIRCPYRVGEIRYLKETWAPHEDGAVYLADDPGTLAPWRPDNQFRRWSNPMCMPRRLARTWIEILSVRPARCQEITEDEALVSGVLPTVSGPIDPIWCPTCRGECVYDTPSGPDYGVVEVDCADCDTVLKRYRNLWDRLNRKRGFPWSGNWWTWRCTFRKVGAPQ